EQRADLDVAVRAAVHDGRGPRERVHRSRRRSVPVGARRNRLAAVPADAPGQFAVALAHLGHEPCLGAGARARALCGGAVSTAISRKMASALFTGFCAAAVLLALVPLGFLLFFIVNQGLTALNVGFFTRMPRPVGEAGGGMANSIVGTLIVC